MKKLILSLAFLLIANPLFAAVKNFSPASDAVILTATPTTNQNTINSVSKTWAANDGYLMKYDLSTIAGQTAIHAYLNIWTSRGFQHNSNIFRVLRDFTANQVTYNIYSTGNSWTTAGALGSTTDYTTTNSAVYTAQADQYYTVDVTNLVNDCLTAGGNCNIEMRYTTGVFETIHGVANSTTPPYLTVSTGTPGVPVPWYVRDDGAAFGSSSTTCNGTANVGYTAGAGPNCAVNNPMPITGIGNAVQWVGGDIMYIDGDSHTSYDFTVSGITIRPAVGDTYTNNSKTFTVTVSTPTGKSSGTLRMSGTGAPSSSGTLTRSSGSGDATITFSAEGAAQAMYAITSTLTIPQGASLSQPTKIVGTGTHWPQLWASGSTITVIDATTFNYDVENVDITAHDNCIKNGPLGPGGATTNSDGFLYVCAGGSNGGSTGVMWGGSGTFTNMIIHGLYNGMNNNVNGGIVGDITLTNVKVFGNSEQGAVVGNSQTVDNVMTGTISFIDSQVDFNGCGQRYPLQNTTDMFNNISTAGYSSSVDDQSNYYNCYGQNTNGYGEGVGWGPIGQANAGNWAFNNTSLSFNVQEGVDTLHGKGNGTQKLNRCRIEGNGGNQIKLNGLQYFITNNFIGGNCERWIGSPESSTTLGSTGGDGSLGLSVVSGGGVCRANGDTLLLIIGANTQAYIYGNTIVSNGLIIEPKGSGCDSTTGLHVKNNIAVGGAYASQDPTIGGGSDPKLVDFIYNAGSDGNGTGTCGPVGNGTGGTLVPDEDYNLVYNTKNNNSGCNGAHDICGTAPAFLGTIPLGTPSGAITTFYTGVAMMSLAQLTSTSPARGTASVTGLNYPDGTNDKNNFALNTPPDIGGFQYGSSPIYCSGNAAACTANAGCCSGFCVSGACAAYNCGDGLITSPEVCDGSSLNSQTCVTQGFASGSLSCNASCLTFVTSSCTGTKAANGAACTVGGDCISGLCSSLICVANICGNGIIEGTELCDGALLNDQTCFTEGFTQGGSLACSGDCLSFNTSSCTNSSSNVSMGISGSIGGI